MNRTALFVYGTLKQGWSLAFHLEGQQFLGAARTAPHYRLYRLDGYPGLVETEPADGRSIEGELWLVDARCLARLDLVEGVDKGEYARRPITLLEPPDGPPAEAYHFLGRVDSLPDAGACW